MSLFNNMGRWKDRPSPSMQCSCIPPETPSNSRNILYSDAQSCIWRSQMYKRFPVSASQNWSTIYCCTNPPDPEIKLKSFSPWHKYHQQNMVGVILFSLAVDYLLLLSFGYDVLHPSGKKSTKQSESYVQWLTEMVSRTPWPVAFSLLHRCNTMHPLLLSPFPVPGTIAASSEHVGPLYCLACS